MSDYIPAQDVLFDQWFSFFNQYTAEKCTGSPPSWTHIPAAALSDLTDAYTSWHTAYADTLKPHTPVETEAKHQAKKHPRP
jgi:hypothetical protein